MGETEAAADRRTLGRVCRLGWAVAFLGVVFATHFLIVGVGDGGTFATGLAALLFAVVGGEAAAVVGVARLRPSVWYLGMATFAGGALVVALVFLVDPRLLTALYLLGSLAAAAGIHRLRPLFVPGNDRRRRVRAAGPPPDGTGAIRTLRRAEPSIELQAFVAFVVLAAVVSFYKGVQLFWQPDRVSTYVGTAYVSMALLQFRACYGLLRGSRRGWFISLVLCTLLTLVSAYHTLVAEDLGSILIFLFDLSNVVYLWGKRDSYAPRLSIRITPE